MTTTRNTFRVVVWEMDPSPEFPNCKTIRDIMEFDFPDSEFRLDGKLKAKGMKILRGYTGYHAQEGVYMVLERGPFGDDQVEEAA